jgi:hypothetical protein
MFGVSRFNSARRISRSGAIILGGMIDGGQTASIQKFYFSVESAATIGTHTSPLYSAWGATYVGSYGYTLAGYGWLGGDDNYAVQDDARVSYATNSMSALGSPYGPVTKVNDSHASDVGSKSLSFSGYDRSIPGWSASGKKWLFSTESSASISTTMSSPRVGTFVMSNSSTAMYIYGGSLWPNYYCDTNIVDKISYATESRSSFYMTNSKQKDTSGLAFSNSGTAGYAAGGFDGNCSNQATGTDKTEKLNFVNDTHSVLSSSSLVYPAGQYPNNISVASVAGYSAGARGSVVVQKLNFTNDTPSTLSGTMGNAGSWGGIMVDSLGN